MYNPFKIATGAIVTTESFVAVCWLFSQPVKWWSVSSMLLSVVLFVFGLVWFIRGTNGD